MADLSHGAPARGLQGWLLLTLVCAVGCFDGLIEDPSLDNELGAPAGPPNLPAPAQNPGVVAPAPTSTPTPAEPADGPAVATDPPPSPNPGVEPPFGKNETADWVVDAGVSPDAGDAGKATESSGMSSFADSGSGDLNVSK